MAKQLCIAPQYSQAPSTFGQLPDYLQPKNVTQAWIPKSFTQPGFYPPEWTCPAGQQVYAASNTAGGSTNFSQFYTCASNNADALTKVKNFDTTNWPMTNSLQICSNVRQTPNSGFEADYTPSYEPSWPPVQASFYTTTPTDQWPSL